MTSSATLARQRSWGQVIAVVAVILGMLAGFGALTAAPAWADAACAAADDHPGFDFERLSLELSDGDGGVLVIDTTDGNVTCTGDQSLSVFLDDVKVEVIELDPAANNGRSTPSDGTDIHLSCSDNYLGATIQIGDAEYTVTDFTLASRHRNQDAYISPCTAFPDDPDPDPVDPVASLSAGECEFDQASTYPVTYSLTINDGEGPFALFVDGDEDTTVTLTEGPDQLLGYFAPGTELEIRDGSTVLASTSVADATCVPDPDPPTPAITLVKSPVVGEGSDLVDLGGPNPLLQFSDSDQGPKTALYTYLITNTGEEPLIDISLADDRIAAADLDLSDCTAAEPLAVGDSCTATGSEDFTLADAQDDEDGLITNTGTVTAVGEESETSVDDTDPATIALAIVFSEVQEKDDVDPVVGSGAEEKTPAVQDTAAELPATGLDDDGLLPLALLLIAMGAALLWLDRDWAAVR